MSVNPPKNSHIIYHENLEKPLSSKTPFVRENGLTIDNVIDDSQPWTIPIPTSTPSTEPLTPARGNLLVVRHANETSLKPVDARNSDFGLESETRKCAKRGKVVCQVHGGRKILSGVKQTWEYGSEPNRVRSKYSDNERDIPRDWLDDGWMLLHTARRSALKREKARAWEYCALCGKVSRLWRSFVGKCADMCNTFFGGIMRNTYGAEEEEED
ncbi:hypothetical protein F4604DRAFT_1903413 [Suillus subluteus]|nr:hypothetical protein F4604DRAFT_1903413 [Suillus subluteus]